MERKKPLLLCYSWRGMGVVEANTNDSKKVVLLFYSDSMRSDQSACQSSGNGTQRWGRSFFSKNPHCTKSKIYVFPGKELRGRSPNSYIHVSVSDFIYSQDRSTYLAAAKFTDRPWKYINLSPIYERRNWEIEHYNSRLHRFMSGNT